MKRFTTFSILFLLVHASMPPKATGIEALDALLPTPHLLRSRADDLKVDESTKQQIEKLYKAAEPKYHQLKSKLDEHVGELEVALLAEPFDSVKITQRTQTVLSAENELKLYQVRVRVRLLSQVTPEQRQSARNYASEMQEEARWNGVVADGTLDNLLPTPFWLRSRAEELGVDATTRERLEQTYKTLEPKYHELKKGLKPHAEQFLEVVLADNLDERAILVRFDTLLDSEMELKLYMMRVRTSLFSEVSAEVRRAARELAKDKPKGDWRKVLSDKVVQVRELGERLNAKGQSITHIETRIADIEGVISKGLIVHGARQLDQLIEELDRQSAPTVHLKSNQKPATLPPVTFRDVAYGPHRRNVLDFWQAESDEPTPLAVYFHGGGFITFDKSKIASKWPMTVKALLDAKISVAAVNYRLIQDKPLPAAFHDGRRALQFLRTKSEDWNFEESRVGAWGGSAGAQMATYLAFHDDMANTTSSDPLQRRSTRLACVATRDGQTSRDYQWWIDHIPEYDQPHRDFHEMFGVKTRDEFLKKMSDVSALSLITKDDPPIYMNYEMKPDDPVPESSPDNPRATISFQGHHVVFGIELKKKMETLGVAAYLDHPSSNSAFRSVEQFLIACLKQNVDVDVD